MSFTVPRGSNKTFELTLTDHLGALLNLTGAKLYFSVKLRTADQSAVLRKRNTAAGGSDSEIEVLAQSGATLGKAKLKFIPADTETLPLDGYLCDLWVITSGGERAPALEPQEFKVAARVSSDFSP